MSKPDGPRVVAALLFGVAKFFFGVHFLSNEFFMLWLTIGLVVMFSEICCSHLFPQIFIEILFFKLTH